MNIVWNLYSAIGCPKRGRYCFGMLACGINRKGKRYLCDKQIKEYKLLGILFKASL